MADATFERSLRRVYFALLNIDTAPVRVNSTGQNITWSGNTWYGVGSLGGIDGLGTNSEMAASQIVLSLSDIPRDYIGDLQTNNYQYETVQIWQNDLSANNAVTSSLLIWEGIMDTASVEIGDTCTISMSCESLFSKWGKVPNRRMNGPTQQFLHTGDKFLDYVASLRKVSIQL